MLQLAGAERRGMFIPDDTPLCVAAVGPSVEISLVGEAPEPQISETFGTCEVFQFG